MEESSDRGLVMDTRRGEVEAYGELVRRYQGSVFNVCYRMIGERQEAEDVTQEAFIRAFERLETYDAGRPFGPWIRRVAINLCYNRFQARKPFHASLEEESALAAQHPDTQPEIAHDRAARAERVRAAILQLPPAYRVAIELRHFQDLSYAEMADALEISISQVKSNLFRARKALAKILVPFHDESDQALE